MKRFAHLASALVGAVVGLALSQVTRSSEQATVEAAASSPKRSSFRQGTPYPPNPAFDQRLKQIDRGGVWLDVPEELFQLQVESGRWSHLVGPRTSFSPLLARALEIPDEDISKVHATVRGILGSFQDIDLELHQIRREGADLILTVPAYPNRGQEVMSRLQVELTTLASDRAAGVVMAIVRGSHDTAAGYFGTLEKEIRLTRGEDGIAKTTLRYGGRDLRKGDYWIKHLKLRLHKEAEQRNGGKIRN